MRRFDFLKKQFLLAHVSGIPVRIDYRWFFVLALMSWITASIIITLIENVLASFIFGLLTTLVFFVSILIHEYAHAVIARMEGLKVLEIVLHPFGGLARLKREPDTPRAEFRIAIAGPAASFMLAVAFAVLMAIADALALNILALLFFMLALSNFLLAVFNLFPGYPLDGGRVLRAYLWRSGKNLNEATVLTGRSGQIIAVALIVFGLFIAIMRADFFTGFWTILVGFFLYDAAKDIIRGVNNFENLIVREVMQLAVAVAPDVDVQHFVDRVLPFHRRQVFPVAKDKQLYGILMLEDLKKIPPEAWRITKIQTVMRPIMPDYFVESDAALLDARKLMRENGIGALGVIDAKGNLVGFMQRGRLKKRN
ncbi:MAG: site-2 protease family protein [Pyrinomonadaceae bacterium]|nr:site-2 protease family protein [Pyrinomonadaceae bacterium]